jgi:phosphatidylglycerol:prolipoprotein diacylglycerol transferase
VTFPNFDPFVPFLHWGEFGIRWYALAYVAGILLGWWYAGRQLRDQRLWAPASPPMNANQLDDLVLWITLGVIVGGRLGYVLFYDLVGRQGGQDGMLSHPWEIFMLWKGGMAFHGGLVGVTVALLLFAWRNKINALAIGDLVAPAVPIGLFFGRIANFINGELWGRPTNLPWGVVFCNDRLREAGGGMCAAGEAARHPSQLYEATLEGIVLFLVLRFATHKAHLLPRRGAVTGVFLVGYGLVRASLENVREPDDFMPHFPLGMTMGMLLSIPMILAGAWLLWRAWRQPVAAA